MASPSKEQKAVSLASKPENNSSSTAHQDRRNESLMIGNLLSTASSRAPSKQSQSTDLDLISVSQSGIPHPKFSGSGPLGSATSNLQSARGPIFSHLIPNQSYQAHSMMSQLQFHNSTSQQIIDHSSVNRRSQKTHFLSLPKIIRKEIFSHLIPVDTTVKPTFRQGMLVRGVYSDPLNDNDLSVHPNLDTEIIRVNKALQREVTDYLYGTNEFILDNAAASLWWFKRIGPANTSLITRVRLTLGTGWLDLRDNDLLSCEEEIWCRALGVIRNTHQISDLQVTIYGWKDLTLLRAREELQVTIERAAIMVAWRRQAFEAVAALRGLRDVTIDQRHCYYANDDLVDGVIATMKQPRGPPPMPPPRLSLSALIAHCRARRIQREVALARRRQAAMRARLQQQVGRFG